MSLSVEQLSVAIGGTTILDQVDLTLDDREIVAVLGPSGSGKTTLLRVIAGLQAPTHGRVTVDGVDITELAAHRRGIGLMFQDHALFPHRDVRGNVAFGLRMAGASPQEIDRRVAEVLDLVGLSGFDDRGIAGLSGGERQRVALARALAPRPRIMLLDEPLGSLDRALRDRLVDELSEVLRASGVSVIYVTHDQSEAFAIGDRLVVMRDGTVAQSGSPDHVWARPVDARSAAIVGPVTLVAVHVEDDGRVHAPWGLVQADPGGLRGSGSLVIRPDSLAVENPACPTDIDATVVRTIFRGDHRAVIVSITTAEGPPIELPLATMTGDAVEPGTAVGLRPTRELVVVPN